MDRDPIQFNSIRSPSKGGEVAGVAFFGLSVLLDRCWLDSASAKEQLAVSRLGTNSLTVSLHGEGNFGGFGSGEEHFGGFGTPFRTRCVRASGLYSSSLISWNSCQLLQLGPGRVDREAGSRVREVNKVGWHPKNVPRGASFPVRSSPLRPFPFEGEHIELKLGGSLSLSSNIKTLE